MTETAGPWILTGMSGAGKRTALDALVRAGVECIDNLPIALVDAFAAQPRTRPAVAVVDARSGVALRDWVGAPEGTNVIFLDAADAVLVKRLSESTLPHPCVAAGNATAQVAAERALIAPLRAAADVVIDTSTLTAAELALRITQTVVPGGSTAPRFHCVVSSFGFKYGPQTEADWVVDVRFLPNPFWEPELRPLTGLDDAVSAYVLDAPETRTFLEGLSGVLESTIRESIRRHRTSLHIAVGCTGGRHRSVAISAALAARLRGMEIPVDVRHRDVERPDPR